MRSSGAVCACALGLAIACAASADPPSAVYQATVVHVRDGDSLIVSDGEVQHDLRLAEIDAPERGQPGSAEAERALARLVGGRTLRVQFVALDRYGREVSKLSTGALCVECELVRLGHAWAFRKYLRDPKLLDLERDARAARRGLWSRADATPVPPSAWRRGLRTFSAERLERYLSEEESESDSDAFACAERMRCEQMSSCAEARFWLEHCAATQLDRDGDGVPCDARCR